jgi:hypothetical protein
MNLKGKLGGLALGRPPFPKGFSTRGLHEAGQRSQIHPQPLHNLVQVHSNFSTYPILTQAPGNLTCLLSHVLLVSFIQPAKVQYLASPNGRGTLHFPVMLISL